MDADNKEKLFELYKQFLPIALRVSNIEDDIWGRNLDDTHKSPRESQVERCFSNSLWLAKVALIYFNSEDLEKGSGLDEEASQAFRRLLRDRIDTKRG